MTIDKSLSIRIIIHRYKIIVKESEESLENMEIRLKARGAGIPLWKVAEHIGISEPTLTRWMRQTLSKEKKTQILTAIRDIKEKNTAEQLNG